VPPPPFLLTETMRPPFFPVVIFECDLQDSFVLSSLTIRVTASVFCLTPLCDEFTKFRQPKPSRSFSPFQIISIRYPSYKVSGFDYLFCYPLFFFETQTPYIPILPDPSIIPPPPPFTVPASPFQFRYAISFIRVLARFPPPASFRTNRPFK